MRNDNLTFDEAQTRSELLDVERYDVHVDLTYAADPQMPAFPVTATITFAADVERAGADETFLEYIHHSVDEVELNGRPLDVADVVEGSRIRLPELRASNTVVVRGRSLYSRSGEGLHRFIDPEDGRTYLYTQYEPSDCRRVFPTFEQPDLKSVFRFSITAPADWAVASNTEIVSTHEDPVLDGVSKRVFAPTRRMSTYITTLLAGQYHAVSKLYRPSIDGAQTAPMTLYCRQSMARHLESEEIFDLVARGLDFFQELFDYPYPWGKYDQAFVPEYNLGAMENPGLVTFTEAYLFPGGSTMAQREGRADVIMHEMSHMWFGDLVTMRWWSDLWLKESFAEYMGSLGAERVGGYEESWVTFAHRRKAWAYIQDEHSTTHPIVADIPDVEAAKQNFDGITYAKGASVLKQLVAYVGFERFIGAARTYFRRHEFGTAELADFLAALEEACGRDLSPWAEAWLQTRGVSVLGVDAEQGSVQQALPESVPASLGRPHVLKAAVFALEGEKLVRQSVAGLEIAPGQDGESTELNGVGQVPDGGLLLLNQDDLTYALTELSPAETETALRYGHTIEAPLDRAVLGSALWAMVRAGNLDPRRYAEHVAQGLGRETSATLLDTLLIHAETALLVYLGPEERTEPLSSFAQTLAVRLPEAEQGSDAQHIMLRHALRLARETRDLVGIAADLVEFAESAAPAEGPARWNGVELSDELVWSARTALAAHGQLTREAASEALGRTPSQHASIGAARTMAALPSPEEKKRAWESIFGEDLSNDLLSATAVGIGVGPAQLRTGLAEDYFARLDEVWESHSIGMATRIVRGLFPSLDDAADPLAAAQAWLAEHTESPRALRREVTEQLEDAERAAAIRSRWS